jgi:hypothetical protein
MEGIVGWMIVGFVGWWFFKLGKQNGSRLGFRAGRRRFRR